MREIKFRGFFEGKMFEVKEINFYLGTVKFKGSLGIYDIDKLRNPLMQYTGLKDKNGKEIYEGDIIIPKEMHDSNIDCWKKPREVKWFQDGFYLPYDLRYWEIIGNIYENPKLLTP